MPRTLIEVDRNSAEPLYRQVRRAIEHGIANGLFDPRHRLPSSRELAVDLAISRNTINLAYQELIAEGLVQSHQRSGMFVNPDMIETLATDARATIPRIDWSSRIRRYPDADVPHIEKNVDWHSYPYPFLAGQIDIRSFPRPRVGALSPRRAVSTPRLREPPGQRRCGRPDADRHDPPASAALARHRGERGRGSGDRRFPAGPGSRRPGAARTRTSGCHRESRLSRCATHLPAHRCPGVRHRRRRPRPAPAGDAARHGSDVSDTEPSPSDQRDARHRPSSASAAARRGVRHRDRGGRLRQRVPLPRQPQPGAQGARFQRRRRVPRYVLEVPGPRFASGLPRRTCGPGARTAEGPTVHAPSSPRVTSNGPWPCSSTAGSTTARCAITAPR